MKHEYHEGPKALDNFNKGMTKLFQASKDALKEKPKQKAKRKKSSKD
jgi:hypothetical protein